MSSVRVRFAPSPTGKLHIGSARTALINYLFARSQSGVFILRIEDTDQVRSTKENEQDILEGLTWLGLQWDEGPGIGGNKGPYYQSERMSENRYQPYIERLLREGKAYRCFCSSDDIQQQRTIAEKQGKPYRYDRRCSQLSVRQINEKMESGCPYTVRFKTNNDRIEFKDMIRGPISFDMELEDDFIIQRSDGSPTYNFVVVVDDYEMEISHVIRGEDHISNTPKQILLYRALGFAEPIFAHLSIILGPDKSKLSKRHGAKSINEYRVEGILSETLFNYILLLGWSHPESQELISKNDAHQLFSIDRVSKSNTVYDIKKLEWLNHNHISELSDEKLEKILGPWYPDTWETLNRDQYRRIIGLVKDHLTYLSEFAGYVDVFINDDIRYSNDELSKIDVEYVRIFFELLTSSPPQSFRSEDIQTLFNKLTEDQGMKKGLLYKSIRFAISGKTSGLSFFDLVSVLGYEKVLKRISAFLKDVQ